MGSCETAKLGKLQTSAIIIQWPLDVVGGCNFGNEPILLIDFGVHGFVFNGESIATVKQRP